jgi:hypothetical protein
VQYQILEPARTDGEPTGDYLVWNIRTHRIEAEFQAEVGTRHASQHISPDGRWLAARCENQQDHYFELRDFPSGRLVGKTREILHYADFSPDSRFIIMDDQGPSKRVVLEVPSLKVLWKQNEVAFHPTMAFSHNARIAFAASKPSQVEAYDIATGSLCSVVRLASKHPSDGMSLQLTLDRRVACVHQTHADQPGNGWLDRILWLTKQGKNDSAVVFDTNTSHERFSLVGWDTREARLSDDGSTLVTVHRESNDRRQRLRCWDVDARKPLDGAVGVPTGLAALLGLFMWRRTRHARAFRVGL